MIMLPTNGIINCSLFLKQLPCDLRTILLQVVIGSNWFQMMLQAGYRLGKEHGVNVLDVAVQCLLQ
jgi:hypothetical protein